MPNNFYTHSDSEISVGGPLRLQGIWIHDPEDPVNTLHHFLYGRDMRSSEIDIGGKELVFAGRKFPVYDYGEHQKNKMSVGFQILHGSNYDSDREVARNFAVLKKPLVIRDGRGRVFYGVIEGFKEEDQSYGTDIAFDVIEVNREIFEVD